MEGHYPTDSCDPKFVTGRSTFMVASLQEIKDRISQIEYIFCGQLFPNFQTNHQNFHKIYSIAREAAEDANKQKEKDLLLQIKELQCQNQQVMLEKARLINKERELQEELNRKTLEVNESREAQQNLQKLVESKLPALNSYDRMKQELEEKNRMLMELQKKIELDTEGLRQELMKRSKEVDGVMELHNKTLHVNQSQSSLIVQKENQLKEYEKKTNVLISKLEKMESQVNELESQLREKAEKVEKGRELQGNLLKKIESQASEIMDNEQLSNKLEKENKLLASKVTSLIDRTDELQKELGKKTSELEKVRKEHDQLLRQSDSSKIEIVKREQALKEFKEEKKRLQDNLKSLGEKADKLQQSLSEKMRERIKLSQQIEAKDSELHSVRRKMTDVLALHKNLRSQFNYLCKKFNICEEAMPTLEDENEVMRHNRTPGPSYDNKKTPKASDLTCDVMIPLENKNEVVPVQKTSPDSPITSHVHIAPKCPSGSKPCPSAGIKRPHSYWRDTRSNQSRVGPDPHDDFLDTPLENVRENLGKAMKEVRPDILKPSAVNMRLDDSDDQTQDIKADAKPNKLHKSPPRAGTSDFKYVEPVRKKADRENLKGVECKQCKKFYDAVLPGAGDTDKQSIRCEHQDGVSRHRYRYAPPSTPEGFWNIGFESDM